MSKKSDYEDDKVAAKAKKADTESYLVMNDGTAIKGVVCSVGDVVQLTKEEAAAHRERGVPLGSAP